MSEINGTNGQPHEPENGTVGGFGVSANSPLLSYEHVHPKELKLIRRAIRNGWGVSQELKQKILDRAELIIDAEPDEKIALGAMKIVLEADKVDVQRERNEIEEQHNEVSEATAVIRTAMQSSASVREKIAQITAEVCKPKPETK